jgi:hypothetical protein
VSLLLDTLNYLAVRDGVNVPMYLSMDFLLNYLTKKADPFKIKVERERLTVLSTLTILQDLEGEALCFVDQRKIKEETAEQLSSRGLIISSQTFGSRIVRWRPDRFLEVLAVPVDVLMKRSKGSKRYDSYTKGYGEGSGSAGRRKKLKFSAETDGIEERDLEFSLNFLNQYFYLNRKEIERKKKKNGL